MSARCHPKSIRRLVLMLSLAWATGASAGDPSRAAAFYEDGLARFQQGDTAGAVIQLKNALQQDNSVLSAHVLLGRALLEQTELPAAEAAFEEALRLGVSPSEIAVPRGRLLMLLGRTKALLRDIRPDGLRPEARIEVLSMRGAANAAENNEMAARESFQAAIDTDPQSPRPYLSLVPFLLQKGEILAAREATDRAMTLAPEDARVWNLRASVRHIQGDLTGALADYDAALERDPKYVDARVARASLRVDIKRDVAAAEDLAYLAEHAKAEPRSAYLRAVLAGRKGKGEAVHAALSEVVSLTDALEPEYLNSHEQLLMLGALSHHGLGAVEKAKSYLDTLLSRYPRNLAARKLLANIYMGEGDSVRAINTVEPVLRARPDDPQALLLIGRANLADKRYARATRYLERAAALLENDGQIQAALGISLLGGGDAEEGLKALERAFDAAPGNGGVGMVLASLYMRSGETDKALRVAETLVAENHDDLAALNLLGAVRAANGDVAGARQAYEQVIARDARFIPAHLNLARIESSQGQHAAARQRLTRLATAHKDDTRVMLELGQLEQRAGNLTAAVEWLRKATAKAPNDPGAGLALVEILHLMRQPEAALNAAKEVALRNPQNFSALTVLGQAYLASGEAAAARLTFRDMTRLAEFDPDAQVRIGRLLLDAGFPDDAEYNAQKALTAASGYTPALALNVDVALARRQPEAARAALESLRAMQPGDATVARYEAAIALAAGNNEQAVSIYQRAYAASPDADAAMRLARAHLALGKPAAARKVLEKELARRDSKPVRRALAELAVQANDWKRARDHYATLLTDDAANIDLLNNYAMALLETGDAQARSVAEKARTLAPHDPLVADTLGWILLRQGDADAALGLLRDARLRAPDNPEVRYHLAVALKKAGHASQAREELDASLRGAVWFPGVEAAKQLRAQLN